MTFQQASPPNMITKTGLITSAQLLACFTTPIMLIPAPGVGLGIDIISVALTYKFGGTAYTDGGGNIVVANGGNGYLQQASLGWWDQAVDMVMGFTPENFGKSIASQIRNVPITFSNTVANPTLGNGTCKWDILYRVINM